MRRKKIETEENQIIPGTLYLVSTPIGNDDDITLRALKVLKSVDIVVCEEAKIGARILHTYNLTQKMELLNEQNEKEKTDELIELLTSGKNLALISDCGTPVFADPGLILVQKVIAKEIKLSVIPGPSSIMTAIVRSGFSLDQFLYAGFLSRSREERMLQLVRLKNETKTVVLFETPYRLIPMLDAARTVMPDRRVYIGCNLTMSFETHHYGTFSELFKKFSENKFKGEFIIVFEGASLEDLKKPEPEIEYFDEDEDDSKFNRLGKILEGAYYEDQEYRSYAGDKNKPSRFSHGKGAPSHGGRKNFQDKPRKGGFKKGPKPGSDKSFSSSEPGKRKPFHRDDNFQNANASYNKGKGGFKKKFSSDPSKKFSSDPSKKFSGDSPRKFSSDSPKKFVKSGPRKSK